MRNIFWLYNYCFYFKSDLQMGICTTDRKLLFYVDLFVGIYRIYSIGIVLTLYGYIWKIEYDTQEIIYRSALGITRKYRIEDITRCVGKRRNQYRFYQGEKKIFQYEMDAEGDVYDLLIILKKRGIDEEELIPSTKEHCIVEPMIIRKILPIIGFCI